AAVHAVLRAAAPRGAHRRAGRAEPGQDPVFVIEFRALGERHEVVRVEQVLRREVRNEAPGEREQLGFLVRDHLAEEALHLVPAHARMLDHRRRRASRWPVPRGSGTVARMDVADPRQFFLERFGLSDRALEHVLGTALERRADHAECYFEFRVNQTASLEDGVVKKATRNVSQGVGVRVLAGTRTGYAYSDEVSLERLEIAARTARFIADERGGDRALPAPSGPRVPHDLYALSEPPIDAPVPDQVALLARLDAVARAADPAITDRIGTRVASELCTVIDDGTIPLRRGSLNVDDEGTPTSRTVLIEKGILRGYLQDRLNASLMGMPLTGNGRRESFAHVPMPRMTNTFMLSGEDAPEDI